MKRLALAALLLLVSSCASLPAPPPGWFDCSWAKFWDFQQSVAHPRSPRWTPVLCNVDPTEVPMGDGESKARRPSSPAPTADH